MSDRWGADRLVRAEVIVALLLGASEAESGQVAAVRLTGARITGTLNLGHAEVSVPLALTACSFDEQPHLYWARMQSVHLLRCRMPGLVASGMRVDGHLWLEGSRIAGGVWLDNAHIAGILNLSGVQLANPGGEALLADRLTVDANVYCDRGFAADGEVRLPGARVGGQLILRGARLGNQKGDALYASRLTVAANMFCDEGFTAQGAVRLRGARVGGYLSLQGATLIHPGRIALNAGDLAVETDVYCSEGFQARGEVTFGGARVGGQLSLIGARLHNPEGRALGCQRLQAAEMDLRPAEPITGLVDLSYAKVGRLRDDPATWPTGLQLDGFMYETLNPPLTAKERLQWLRRDTDGYQPQPYERLAESYRAIGLDADGRSVLLAKQRDRRRTQSVPRKIWGLVQDVLVGYGYRPFRAAAWFIVFLAIGTVTFRLHRPLPVAPGQGPRFNAFLYTLDLLLPIGPGSQESAYAATGGYLAIAYVLIAASLILGLTLAAGALRVALDGLPLLWPRGRPAQSPHSADSVREVPSGSQNVELAAFAKLRDSLLSEVVKQIKETIAEAVHGPPLSNFVGYFSVGTPTSANANSATIISSPGQSLSLVATVVRDGRARQLEPEEPDHTGFFAVESVIIENGSDSHTANFEVIADSPTLSVSPDRADMAVADNAQATFQVKIPEAAGAHEIWFQLFQGGRVIQVLTIPVEAVA